MTWSAVLLALLVSHAVGDVLLQTDWQATNKVRGLGDATSRRALAAHLGTYMLAFVPALVWIADRTMAWRALVVLAIIAIPHLAIDDGRIVRLWLHRVKGATSPGLGLSIAVDQSLHVLCLLAAALVAAT